MDGNIIKKKKKKKEKGISLNFSCGVRDGWMDDGRWMMASLTRRGTQAALPADSCIFCFHSDEEELRKSFSELGDSLCDSNASRSTKEVGGSEKPLPVGSEPSGMLLYKNGFLVRKVHADSDGKRSTQEAFLTL